VARVFKRLKDCLVMKCSRRLTGGEVRLTNGFGAVRNIVRGLLALALLALASFPAIAQVNVLTYHNDIARTGQNTNETILTPANVNQTTFGKLFSYTIDGYAYAQPLYYANLAMGAGTAQAGTTHNVFFIATENDSVYAFDADNNGGANASPLWKVSLIDAAHGAGSGEAPMPATTVGTTDIVPQIGITGTPVIDPTTNTMYVVAKSVTGGTTFIQRLHAIDITTGLEKFGGPVTLAGQVSNANGNGSSGGILKFDPMWENQRPALMLLHGIVYIGFASHGDNGPWHGWLLAYNAATLQQTSVFCTSPGGQGSGIWQGGAGMAADVPDPVNHPYGRMFLVTGNGTYDATTPYANGMDFGDDDLRFDLTNGVITIQDSFTPMNQANLSSTDQDLGSGGVVLLPPQTGAHPNELVQVGKANVIYLVDRDAMGGYNPNSDNNVQEISGQLEGGIWGIPAYWNGNIYFWGRNDRIRAYSIAAGKLSGQWTSQGPVVTSFATPTPSVSSSGTTNGVVWAIETDTFGSSDPGILRAYDATNVATEFYNSSQNASRDAAPQAVKFTVPTIANGKVYVGGALKVSVYGLLNGVQTAATPVISPAGKSFTGSISVTISDTTPNAAIFYTIDGTTPTSASTAYAGPITVTNTETITAIATATGFVSSQPASQTYTNGSQTLAPSFTPPAGAYASAQTVTLSDASPASKIYYTLDGTTPAPGAGTTKLYAAPLAVSQTTTIQAIATATGLSNSPVAVALYAVGPSFSVGFAAAPSSMTFNGSTGLDDSRLQLTDGGQNEAGSAFFNVAQNIQSFTTDFSFQQSNPIGDGMTFTIQNAGLTALGPNGGGLGYGPAAPDGPGGIPTSVAIKFDLFSNQGEGPNSTGLYTNGASPTMPAVDLTPSGINLHSGSTISAHIVYDGTNLSMTLTDTTNDTFTQTWPINIAQTIGSNTAYIGFTGGTGGNTSSQKVESWTFTSTVAPPPTPPAVADFTMTAQSASVTVAAGAQGTSTIMVAPSTGSTFGSAVALTCAVTGSATPLPTCALSPASVTPGSQGATSTLTISVAASAAIFTPSNQPGYFDSWKIVGASGTRLAVLASLFGSILLVLTLSRYQRKFRPRYAWLTAALLIALCQTACGGGGGTSTAPPTPPETSSQTYTVTVTGVSTTATSVKIQHAATITVTVP
jgi:hypothetical protein